MPATASQLSCEDDKEASCLVEKLRYYVDLSDTEISVLKQFEESPRTFARRRIVRRQGEEASELFVVRSGWVYSFAILPDGGRQVLDIHFPGDIVGLTSIAFEKAASGIASVNQVEICPFPKQHLDKVFRECPRVTALLFAMGMLENVVLVDRLKSIGRMEARDRVAHFLLQIQARLRLTNRRIKNSFTLPLSQELIGDALGLSSIHVNRTFRRLEEEGFVEREKQTITLLREEKLSEMVDFNNRYYKIETDWFPQ